jgi:hypothetical protein
MTPCPRCGYAERFKGRCACCIAYPDPWLHWWIRWYLMMPERDREAMKKEGKGDMTLTLNERGEYEGW